MVLSQPVIDPLSQLWDNATFVGEYDESMRISVENLRAKRVLNDIEPPGFDLGIISMKNVESGRIGQLEAGGSGLLAYKGKGKLFDDKNNIKDCDFKGGIDLIQIAEPMRMMNPSHAYTIPVEDKGKAKIVAPKKEICELGSEDT
ncbi:hypothetical protein L6452_43604 [Arctium lappa]|uniref:Uncharacterized protein n=1 Tax=Arctium lappa TaxID=4217 RepID=A0ACB8XF71_ARCLA|nr:hypothetical protein L6452_43604 [Arctium lappa]